MAPRVVPAPLAHGRAGQAGAHSPFTAAAARPPCRRPGHCPRLLTSGSSGRSHGCLGRPSVLPLSNGSNNEILSLNMAGVRGESVRGRLNKLKFQCHREEVPVPLRASVLFNAGCAGGSPLLPEQQRGPQEMPIPRPHIARPPASPHSLPNCLLTISWGRGENRRQM